MQGGSAAAPGDQQEQKDSAEDRMNQYRVLVFCTYCDRTHPTKLTLSLKNGPIQKATVAAAYNIKVLPLEVIKLLRKDILCPESGSPLPLDDPDRLYLVPPNTVNNAVD